MVTKKRTARRAAPRRAAPARRAPARRSRRSKSGIPMIPAAAATAALVAVNAGNIKDLVNGITNNGKASISEWPTRLIAGARTRTAAKNMISSKQLITDAAAVAGGYIGGEIVKKYAPSVIKAPLGKIAKKIPKVL